MKIIFAVLGLAALLCLAPESFGQTQAVRVDITNNAPAGGLALTPLWVGFHDGSFDSYNGGLSSQVGLERLAEDGNNSVIDADFQGGYTYIDDSSGMDVSARVLTSQTSGRVSGSLDGLGRPILAGESTSAIFNLDSGSNANRYFSYASMILPSNDYYIANGNPTARDLSSLLANGGSITFNIGLAGTINDAGTEVNDFDTSAGNPLFPGLGSGQGGPNEGANQNGVNSEVLNAFGDFANIPAGADLSLFDFNDASIYENGLATITITAIAVPEPSVLALLGLSLGGLVLRRRK